MKTLRELRNKRGEASHVQMAPMIDMVFLLLVFFMCVSSLSQAGQRVRLDLPESVSSKAPKELSNRVVISIKDDGRVFIGGREIERTALSKTLENLGAEDVAMNLKIRADGDVRFEDVKVVMEAASGAGIGEIIYAAYQKD